MPSILIGWETQRCRGLSGCHGLYCKMSGAVDVMKVDHKKEPHYRAKKGSLDYLTVPPMDFLKIDGMGDPNTSEEYRDSLGALYPLAYRIKFFSKIELGRDYVVMPLEGLWWADDMNAFTSGLDKTSWRWTMMIMVPNWITADIVERCRVDVVMKADAPRLIEQVRFERFDEGDALQTLHVGPFSEEGPVISAMHEKIAGDGHALSGTHHEIYLSDPRRTHPAKLKTILRQPIRCSYPCGDSLGSPLS